MRAETALARMCPPGTRYEQRLPGGGVLSFTAADAGHLLAGVPEAPARLCLVKYAGGTGKDVQELRRLLLIEVGGKAQRWDTRIGYAHLCFIALTEYLDARTCRYCLGRGHVREDDKVEECRACEMTGREQWSRRYRAGLLGVDPATFGRSPAEAQYRRATGVLSSWEQEGLRIMQARLRQ